jgi:hypothetical protein
MLFTYRKLKELPSGSLARFEWNQLDDYHKQNIFSVPCSAITVLRSHYDYHEPRDSLLALELHSLERIPQMSTSR